ncbi:phospholipase A2 inhibitor and Ly6/PLAUR domain-containing protein-like [Gopherus flavomarginatus]|uniref:phospholipase A2 inhibitor and Ly6/PLAUR domain-containing protein-like n=1 Tax=Gopherus flavomarginatus TaxID=286002 RepID=UPI0021CC1CF7|nr:phospholipase A2 inhibitor and Ly6/PLAUR domain-containing protein-like [Gopherus flavomarginatus]
MAAHLALCLLSALLAIGGSLKCERCSSSDKACTGEPQDCAPSQTSCLILTSETRVGKEHKLGTYKGCTENKFCPPRSSSLSSAFGLRVRSAAKCCQRDLCNTGAVRLPRAQPKPSGLKCPGCLSDSTECQANETVSCLGAENHCVYFAGSIIAGTRNYTYAVRGCATKSTCVSKVGVYKLPGVFTDIVITSECSPAPTPGPKQST